MPIFRNRTSPGDGPNDRIAALETALATLAREHKALAAKSDDELELLWTLAVPTWLTEAIGEAKSLGWIVERRRAAVVFNYPRDSVHDYPIQLPLPEDPDELTRVRSNLMMRVRMLGPVQ